MRDKVKRFISILMTALMLVNLMPVGGTGGWDYQRRVSAGDGCVYDVWRLGLCLCETYRNSARYNRECARMVYAGKEMGR